MPGLLFFLATVRVGPLGTSEQHVVNLVNRKGQSMAVKLNGLTGVVSFYEGNVRY